MPTPYYPLPTLNTTPTPSYLLFEVEGGGRTKRNELTDRTEHAMIVPFIYTDYQKEATPVPVDKISAHVASLSSAGPGGEER